MTSPDTEYGARNWAKTHPLLTSIAGRAFFRMPAGEPAFPLITVNQIDGVTEDNGIDHIRLTFEVWGQNKKSASDVKRSLCTALARCVDVQLDGDTYVYYVDDVFSTWQYDNEAELARYVVDATFHVRAG